MRNGMPGCGAENSARCLVFGAGRVEENRRRGRNIRRSAAREEDREDQPSCRSHRGRQLDERRESEIDPERKHGKPVASGEWRVAREDTTGPRLLLATGHWSLAT